MKKHRIAIGSDHRGFDLKNLLKDFANFGPHTIEWTDVGTFTPERTDYPLYAEKVVHLIKTNQADQGILLCGSGIGVAMAANRFKGIYSGVVWNEKVARSAKEDDNVNVLSIPADYLSIHEVPDIVQAWLSSGFKEGRYQERIDMVDSFCCEKK